MWSKIKSFFGVSENKPSTAAATTSTSPSYSSSRQAFVVPKLDPNVVETYSRPYKYEPSARPTYPHTIQRPVEPPPHESRSIAYKQENAVQNVASTSSVSYWSTLGSNQTASFYQKQNPLSASRPVTSRDTGFSQNQNAYTLSQASSQYNGTPKVLSNTTSTLPLTGNVPRNLRSKSPRKPRNRRQNKNSNQLGNTSTSDQPPKSKSNSNNKDKTLYTDQRDAFNLGEERQRSASPNPVQNYCSTCKIQFLGKREFTMHVRSDEHHFMTLYQRYRSSETPNTSPYALCGKNQGVEITKEMRGGNANAAMKVELILAENRQVANKTVSTAIELYIHYRPRGNNTALLSLSKIFFVHSHEIGGIYLVGKQVRNEPVEEDIEMKKVFRIQELCIGESQYIIVFKFLNENTGKTFLVMKKVCVSVIPGLIFFPSNSPMHTNNSEERMQDDLFEDEIEDEMQDIQNKKDNERMREAQKKMQEEELLDFILSKPKVVEEAERPKRSGKELKYVRILKEYDLPRHYEKFFNSGFQNSYNTLPDMMQLKCNVLNILVGGLTKFNYDRYFSLLLYLEEHQTLCDLKAHSLKNAPLMINKQDKKVISISVPGLAEDRPSVLKGDAIHIFVQGQGVFKGYVQRVGCSTINVLMGSRFMEFFINNMKGNVYFSFNRSSLKLQHQALEIMKEKNLVKQVCFPEIYGKYIKRKPITCWFNRMVEKNREQRQAVQNIIDGTSLPSPYLLFGPPGTGKTVTLVETMAQIFSSDGTYILATAPSNAAADVLAERLVKILPPSQMMRLYSPYREWNLIPESLQTISNFKDGFCYFPEKEILMKYRIIISTVICAGRLVRGDFPEGHFTHIFVDECGHGLETQALVAVAGLLGREPRPGQLVLSGDPKQLGPIIRSPVALGLGLGLSLLERLMSSCALYQKHNGVYNPQVLTKLIKNFRSHCSILKVPNELFYDGDLQSCAELGVVNSICHWEELPQKIVPIIFHGVIGQETKDEGTPSLFNPSEVKLVVDYVEKILDAKFCGQRLRPADIGIISPYRAQITKLHRALEKRRIPELKELTVGSVEEFQGQERRVIIVSTVRSNVAQVGLDRKYRLGFVKEPKRFNVALTRAKALMIVVGNPHVLETDFNWHKLLHWVMQCKAYKGCKFSLGAAPPPSEPEDAASPVKEKLRRLLQLSEQTLQYQLASVNKWKEGTDLDMIMEQIKNMSFLSEVSELESMVSPPFYIQEQ